MSFFFRQTQLAAAGIFSIFSVVFFFKFHFCKEPYINTKASYYFQGGHLYKSFLFAFPPPPPVCRQPPKVGSNYESIKNAGEGFRYITPLNDILLAIMLLAECYV